LKTYAEVWKLHHLEKKVRNNLKLDTQLHEFQLLIVKVQTYTYIWQTNGQWIDENVPASTESGHPECHQNHNYQPNDRPKYVRHSVNKDILSVNDRIVGEFECQNVN
jgi:hypothetical protein